MKTFFGPNFLWYSHGPGMQLTLESWRQIPKGVNLGCKRRSKCTILEHFWGDFEKLKGSKSDPRCQSQKFFLT